MAEFNDDSLALDYIRQKGRASYSSIKMVRDCSIPNKTWAQYYDDGTAIHSLLLEHKLKVSLPLSNLRTVKLMLQSLASNSIVQSILKDSKNEDKFNQLINGLPVIGFIDINGKNAVGDLKTTRHTKKHSFVRDMEFLQAAIYTYVTKKKDFIYIGISKVEPYEVFTFNVWEYPERMNIAIEQMHSLTKYIKSKL